MNSFAPPDKSASEPLPGRPVNAPEQRRHRRYLTFRTGKIVTDIEDIDCAVLDISAGGARLLAPKEAAIPTAFALVVDPENLRLDCKLAWSDGQMVGVAFKQPPPRSAVWLLGETLDGAGSQRAEDGAAGRLQAPSRWSAKPSDDGIAKDNRRFARMRPTGAMTKSGAIVVDASKPTIPCTIVDVSADGVCIDAHGDAAIPPTFLLVFGATKKPCRVIWMKGRRIGAAF